MVPHLKPKKNALDLAITYITASSTLEKAQKDFYARTMLQLFVTDRLGATRKKVVNLGGTYH